MRYFLALLAACAVSVLAYLLVFGVLVSRPLVIDQVADFMGRKLAYADATPHPKIFVVAGSNARFSHSCAVLEAELHRPCINMGIAADVALDWTLDFADKARSPTTNVTAASRTPSFTASSFQVRRNPRGT